MSSSTYLYISPAISLMPNSDYAADATEQEVALKTDRDFQFCFSEDYAHKKSSSDSRRIAFGFLLSSLKPKDVVVVWSWRCFVNPKRLDFAAFDVQDFVRQLHERQATVLFINENLDTSTALGRQCLLTTLATAQYAYDIHAEKLNKSSSSTGSSSSSTSSSSTTVSAACCIKTSTGC